MPNKFYQSKAWLTKRYKTDGKTAAEISRECGVTEMTIFRYLVKYGLVPNRRSW